MQLINTIKRQTVQSTAACKQMVVGKQYNFFAEWNLAFLDQQQYLPAFQI